MTLPTPGRRRPMMSFSPEEDEDDVFDFRSTMNFVFGEGEGPRTGEEAIKRIKLDPDASPPLQSKTEAAKTFNETKTPKTGTGSDLRIRLKLTKQEIFLQTLGKWYKELSAAKKATLTKNKFKRHAVNEAFVLSLEVQRIPINWLDILRRDYGLEFYKRRKNLSLLEKWDKVNLLSTPVSGFGNDNERRTSSGRRVKTPEILGFTPAPQQKKSFRDDAGGAKSRKIVDKTNELPPVWWIEQYNKTGIAPPRELIIAPMQGTNIVCYEYHLPADYYSKFRKVGEPLDSQAGQHKQARTMQIKYAHEGNRFTWPQS